VNEDLCVECYECLSVGCPTISALDGAVRIDAAVCVGCSVCEQVCPQGAIEEMR